MAINLQFDLMGNPEPPSIVLANRNGNKLGQLNVNVESIDVSDKFNAASEFSFTLNKYIDGEPTPLWDKVVDFKLVYCPEWDLWFEIKVELDETIETVKTVFCTQLGQAELSQIMVYNIHINEEGDPNWDTNNEIYKSTILYDKEHPDISLLDRLLKDKAPHYSIAYVDESIQRIQKTFSFDGTSICDAFNEIAEEIGCLFVYNSNSTKGGKPNRTISVYDLQQNCKDCGHRGEFTDKCPKCESINIKYGYGEDTEILISESELATQGISLTTDTDSVKNCFKLEGGDDLMTATIRNCNPNGSDYIWYFSDALKEDMSKELVEKLESYDEKYQDFYNNHISELNNNLVAQYNALVEKYDDYYNTKSTCLNCGTEGYFYEQCSNPNCNSKNILAGQKLQTIPTTITGYPNLMTAYYNTIDLLLYLKSGLMPNVEIGEKSLCVDCNHEGVFAKVCPKCNSDNILSGAKYQLNLLTSLLPSTVAVNVNDIKDVTLPTANSAVLSMAKVIIKSTYKVEVVDDSSEIEDREFDGDGNVINKLWTGKLKITNYSNEEDVAESAEIEVIVNNDTEAFVKQKINKALNKENTDDYSVTGLFAKELNVDANGNHILDENGICQGAETLDANGNPVCPFCAEIKKYALNPLVNFSKVCDGVISILTEQGIGDDGGNIVVNNEDDELEKAEKKALYDKLYKPYYEKQQAINKEIAIRESEIAIIEGVWDRTDENNPQCTTKGLQQYIENCQQYIQDELNFENHLGEDSWLEFCAYRREDKYSNSNYVSDGLNNAELFKKANEFIEVAEEEIFKSAELQHSISATLNNLLSLPKFKPLLKSFKTGNWIRVQVDDKVYKLRLLEYGFGYGDSESISVEFSDVTKIKNGVTDVKEVLEQASSMASSYNSVQRQAEKGNVARSTIDQWLVDGLNAANMQIASNDSEEVLLTKSGLLARSYDDVTGTYSPEQLKITHNIMAYTDDNWKTVRQSIGKHEYKYFDQDQEKLVDKMGYGMNADFANAAVLCGSQMIGGDIYSNNYSQSIVDGETVTAGSHIDLETGHFSLAGGKLKYDGGELTILGEIEVTTAGRIGCWDINETSIYADTSKITQEDLLKDKTYSNFYEDDKMYFGVQGLSLGDKFKVEPDGIATMTNANVSGTITGSQIIGRNSIFAGKVDKNESGVYVKDYTEDYAEITEDGKLTCTNVDILGGVLKIGRYEVLDENGEIEKDEDGNTIYGWNTWIDENGILKTNESVISGTMYAGAGSIGGFTIEPVKDDNGNTVGGWLYSSGKTLGEDKSIFLSATDMSGTVSKTTLSDWRLAVGENFGVTSDGTAYMSNCEITGGSLLIGNQNDGYYAWISEDGVLNASGAIIDGTMYAIGGTIGGWDIGYDALTSKTDAVKLYSLMSPITPTLPSLVDPDYNSKICISAGKKTLRNSETIKFATGDYSSDYDFIPSVSWDAIDTSTITVTANSINSSVSWQIDEDNGVIKMHYYNGGVFTVSYLYTSDTPTFGVLADGSLYASAANIEGTIYATDGSFTGEINAKSGTIGKLKIENNGISSGTDALSFRSDGLVIAQKLEVKNYFEADSLRIKKISGRDPDYAALYFEDEDGETPIRTISIKASKNVIDEGFAGVFGIGIDQGSAEITLTAFDASGNETQLTSSKTFDVTLRYDNGTSAIYTTQVISITIAKGESSVTSIVGNAKWYDLVFCKLSDVIIVSPDTYIEELPSSTFIIKSSGSLIPSDNNLNLGSVANQWENIHINTTYFYQGTAVDISDVNKKNTIVPIAEKYSALFDMLNPVTFKFNEGQSGRTHIGLIAQELKNAMDTCGIDSQSLAAYCSWKDGNDNEICGIRYGEFIALCIHEIQKLKARVAELENK